MDGTYTGVVDRIVDGHTAVVLLELDDGDLEQLDVPVEELPPGGVHEGAVLEVRVVDGEYVDATYRPEETERRREAAQERFDRLSERLSDSS